MRFGFRELIFIVVLVAVPVVSLVYVFKPRNEEIRQAQDEIQVKQARLDRLAEVTSQIDDLGLELERGRESIAVIEAKLPNEQDVEGIFEQVWQIATNNGLTVKSIKTDKARPAARYRELPLKMIVEGDFDGYYQFLLELENLPRITRIFDMKITRAANFPSSRNGGDASAGEMRSEFTLSIYFQPNTQVASQE